MVWMLTAVINIEDTIITWDVAVQMDHIISAKHPALVVHCRKKQCLLTIVVIPGDNIMFNEAEKLGRYKDLKIEISRIWRARTRVVHMVIRTLGTIEEGFKKNQQDVQMALIGNTHPMQSAGLNTGQVTDPSAPIC